jgi:zinc-binding in reverse transcriptase
LDECALSSYYPLLFSITVKPNITVHDALITGTLCLDFKRQLVGDYLVNWNQLVQHVGSFTIYPLDSDINRWRRHSSSIFFSVHSFYQWLDFGGVINSDYDVVGNSKIPFKIRIFMWLVRKQNILTKDQLIKKRWKGDS